MAREYRPVDRDQPFLLPVSMTDWLDEDHLVWFVIEAVRRLDTTEFHRKAKLGGPGRRRFDPDMVVTLFVYAMAHGVCSSRLMERLCGTDVAFRVICANDAPDHSTLARFRQDHERALADLLTDSLVLAAELGFVRLGVVAVDGTKIAASASREANRTEAGLRKIAERHLAEAAATDLAEAALFGAGVRGDEVPDTVRDRTGRGMRISRALEQIEHRRSADRGRTQAEQATAEAYVQAVGDPSGNAPCGQPPKAVDPIKAAKARLDREHARARAKHETWRAKADRAAADGRKPLGPPLKPVDQQRKVRLAQAAYHAAVADAGAADPVSDGDHAEGPEANLTDPDSRLLKTRNGWVQGYNCQTSISEDQFILHAEPTQDYGDVGQFQPAMTAVTDTAAQLAHHTDRDDLAIGVLLADAGYDSTSNLTAPGPDRLIANAKRRTMNKRAADMPATGDPPEHATARQAIDHRLRTDHGRALYSHRSHLVEAPNAWLKDRRGLRNGFSRRGLAAARSEFRFAAAVTNLLRIRAHGITARQLTNT